MANYTYTKSPINHQNLKSEINSDLLITSAKCIGITDNGTTVTIEMDASLTSNEQTELASVITAHTGIDDAPTVISRMESGTIILFSTKIVAVQYDNPFKSDPKVILQLEDGANKPVYIQNSDVNGFEINIGINWSGAVGYLALEQNQS